MPKNYLYQIESNQRRHLVRRLKSACPSMLSQLCQYLRIDEEQQEIILASFCYHRSEEQIAIVHDVSRSTIQRRKRQTLLALFQAVSHPHNFDLPTRKLIETLFALSGLGAFFSLFLS